MDSEDNKISCQICNKSYSNILLHLKRSSSCANAYSPISKERLYELCDTKRKKKKELKNASSYIAKKVS